MKTIGIYCLKGKKGGREAPETENIFIQTFSGSDARINGRTIYPPSGRAKEPLVVLVHKREDSASLTQLVYPLYREMPEDAARQNIRVVAHHLHRTLKEYGCKELMIHRRGVYPVDPGLFTYDVYESMKGDRKYLSAYTEGYVPEYPQASDAVLHLNAIYGEYREG